MEETEDHASQQQEQHEEQHEEVKEDEDESEDMPLLTSGDITDSAVRKESTDPTKSSSVATSCGQKTNCVLVWVLVIAICVLLGAVGDHLWRREIEELLRTKTCPRLDHSQSDLISPVPWESKHALRSGRRWGTSMLDTGSSPKVTYVTRLAHDLDGLRSLIDKFSTHLCSRVLQCQWDPMCRGMYWDMQCVNGRGYPDGWTSESGRDSIENDKYFGKWEAAKKVLESVPQNDWVFFSDLDVTATNLQMSIKSIVDRIGQGKSVAVVDRPGFGYPNAGCFMVKNNAIGRWFVEKVRSEWKQKYTQEDNGAMSMGLAWLFNRSLPRTTSFRAWSQLLRESGLPEDNRNAHPHVHFFDDVDNPDYAPLCVRALSTSEPSFLPGAFMVHSQHDPIFANRERWYGSDLTGCRKLFQTACRIHADCEADLHAANRAWTPLKWTKKVRARHGIKTNITTVSKSGNISHNKRSRA